MFFDQDIVQRIKVFGIFALQFYKVMTGTMLTLFIPQACYIDNEREQLKICSLTENYENTEVFHKTTFYWNGFSFFLFIMTYILELRREHWAIKYLDINNDIPDNALKEKIVLEPELDRVMDKLNKFYFRSLIVTSGVYCINVLLMIKIIITDYHSVSTLSCFFSFVLLVLMKLYNSLSVGHQSVKNDKMMSAFMNEFVSYNVLDSDYLEQKEKEQLLTNKPATQPATQPAIQESIVPEDIQIKVIPENTTEKIEEP